MSRFNELQKAFSVGFDRPDADPENVQPDAFKKLNLQEAKRAFRDGQKKRKNKKAKKLTNNSLLK